MSNRGKKIFLLLTVVVPFLAYCIIYYVPIIRNAPYRLDEFESVQYKWGTGKELVNSYDSRTGAYQYLNNKDSLVRINVKLRKNDIIYLHSKARELGFWNFPSIIANKGTDPDTITTLRYMLQLNYKRKSKKVIFVNTFDEIPKLRDVAIQMKTIVEQTLNDAEDRYGRNTKSL